MASEQTAERELTDYEAYQQNVAAMQQIVRELKIIPELPSEQVKEDTQPLERVEFPEAGGVLTYMGGMQHPYKGFPFFEFVEKIDLIKKTQRGLMSGLYHALKKRHWWQLIRLTLVPFFFKDFIDAFIVMTHRHIDRFRMKPQRYSDCIRELHRAASLEFAGESIEEREKRFMVRDIVCMFLECDNAYRFRFQDVITELKKDNLKNPTREILRLLGLMMEREKTQEIKDSWRLIKFFLPWYLRSNPSVSRYLRTMLLEVDVAKCVLDAGDKEYCVPRKDYTFAFMVNPSPEDQRLIKIGFLGVAWRKARYDLRMESTEEHHKVLKDATLSEDGRKANLVYLDEKYNNLLKELDDDYKNNIQLCQQQNTTSIKDSPA